MSKIDKRTTNTEVQVGEIHKTLHSLSDGLTKTQARVVQHSGEIDVLKEDCDFLTNKVIGLEKELERAEEKRVKFNLKFFGVPEAQNQKEKSAEIINEVLLTHYPEDEWEGISGIRDAFRLGRPQRNSTRSRPILATISSWENVMKILGNKQGRDCLLYTSPSPRDLSTSRMPSSA